MWTGQIKKKNEKNHTREETRCEKEYDQRYLERGVATNDV